MGDRTFDKSEEAEKFIADYMERNLFISSDKAREAAKQLGSVYKEEQKIQRPPGAFGALSPTFKWVIRNDDLQLMQAVFDGLKAATSVGWFMVADVSDPAKWAVAVAISALVFKVFNQARTKGKRLNERDFKVLFALKKASAGLRFKELLEKLRLADDPWTANEVKECLHNLKNIPVSDGTLRTFVVREGDGRWRTSGI